MGNFSGEKFKGAVVDFDLLTAKSAEIVAAYSARLSENNVDPGVVQEATNRLFSRMEMTGDASTFIVGLTSIIEFIGRDPREFGVHDGVFGWMPKEWKKGGERNGKSR